MLKRVAILIMTNVIAQISVGFRSLRQVLDFFEVGNDVGWVFGKYHVSSVIQSFVFLCRKVGSIKG